MENYMEYRLSKVSARMKSVIVPHIFLCQPDKKESVPRTTSEKRARKRKISEILNDPVVPVPETIMAIDNMQPSTSHQPETAEVTETREVSEPSKHDFCCQARPISYRSKGTQVVDHKKTVTNIATSPLKFAHPKPINIAPKMIVKALEFDSDSSSVRSVEPVEMSPNLDIWQPSQESSDSSELEEDKQKKQVQIRGMFIDIIEEKLRMYTGVPKENMEFLNILQSKSNLKKHFVYLTLYKIKTNDSFEKIGDLFGVSKTYANKIFHKTLVTMAHLMKELIFWPSALSIKKNLPIQFRITFSKVQSIIDCLEIEIQKPSSAKQQALTWSDYKKCNTVKYLISTTPDGLINFISKGYGGRTSDAVIFQNCGYLEVLPENCAVMADRGFKKIETFLNKKNCNLVRPPSVINKEQMSKDDVLLTRRIASVRIHIERIIKRVRDFKMLGPHATVNLDLVQKLDNIIVIACAIINLQQPIIRQ